MKDEPEPPRKTYQFKDKEFERVNRKVTGNTAVTPGAQASKDVNDTPIDIRDLYRSAESKGAAALQSAPVPVENEVHEILRENAARAQAAGFNDIKIRPKRKSKRTRDYWFLFSTGNLFLLLLLIFNPMLGGVGLIVCNLMLVWIMWFVMDDY